MPHRGGLYVITGHDFSGGRDTGEVIERAISGGARLIQLREKAWPVSRLLETGRRIRELTRRAGVIFIVNDRVDIALALEADGVHLGQQDLPVPVVRRMAGPDMIIGKSAGTPEEAVAAEREGASYIGVGPIFPTATKKDARPPRGLELLADIRRATTLPIYAIGGINSGNIASVIRAGADGAAVISAVVGADDIAGAARDIAAQIDSFRQ